jgi:hypothetical protein
VQQNSRPAGTEHRDHLAGRRGDRLQLDQGLAHGFVDHAAPLRPIEQIAVAGAATGAEAAAFHALAVADHDADIEPDQGAHVAAPDAIGPNDFDPLPRPAERGADLLDPRFLGARVGVDLLEHLDLDRLIAALDRVVLAIALAVGAVRRQGERAGIAALHRLDGIDRPSERSLAQIRAVRVTDRLAGDRAQTEAPARVERSALETAIVKRQGLGLAIFQKQFAIVDPGEGRAEKPDELIGLKVGRSDEVLIEGGQIGHVRPNWIE